MSARGSGTLGRPFVLVRFPAIFLSIAAAAAILVAAATAAPLFRSVTGTAAVDIAIGARADRALVIAKTAPLAEDILELRDAQIRAATASFEVLAEPVETLHGSRVRLTNLGARGGVAVRLATESGFATHAQLLDGDAEAPGLWLPAAVATTVRVDVGDPVTIGLERRSLPVRVAAIYDASRSDPYWANLFATVGAEPLPKYLALLDRATFLNVETELQDAGTQAWAFPLSPRAADGLTLDRATELANDIAALDRASGDPTVEFGSIMDNPSFESPVVEAVKAAESGRRTIAPSVQTVALTGEIVAIFGALAAGVYGVRRRRIEMRWLDAKGITWRQLLARSWAEGVLPILVGGVLGWVATWLAVRRFGPSSVIEPSAIRSSIIGSAIVATVAVVVLATVTAISARRQAHESEQTPLSRLSAPAWEAPTLVLAGAALYEIWTRGTSVVSSSDGDVRVDQLLLLFPVLFMAGGAGLVVRALGRLLVRFRGSESLPTSLYLAARRIAAAPRVAMVLVTAAALAIGVLAYAETAVSTIRTSTRDKILVSTGSDVTAPTAGPILPPPPDSGLATTNVFELPRVRTGSNESLTLVGVEPESFETAAFWDDDFSSRSISELMNDLGAAGTDALPAIAVGALSDEDTHVDLAGYQQPIEVVASASAFPGQPEGLALVVSAPSLRTSLEQHGAEVALGNASYEAWARGDADVATAFLVSSGADPGSIQVASERLQTPGYRSLAWSFVFMELLGAVTAVIALIGLLLYLQARQRSRDLSYALARRMGLSSGTHLVAIAAEIAGLLVAAYLTGTALAITTAMLIFRRLDPLPDLPPAPILRPPTAMLAVVAVGIALCAWSGAWLVQRRAEQADVGAELRFAE